MNTEPSPLWQMHPAPGPRPRLSCTSKHTDSEVHPPRQKKHFSVSLSEHNTSIDYAAVFLFLLGALTLALQGQELLGPSIL